jgi:hypothetical protein
MNLPDAISWSFDGLEVNAFLTSVASSTVPEADPFIVFFTGDARGSRAFKPQNFQRVTEGPMRFAG